MRKLRIPPQKCQICGKGATIGYNKPKSLHRTKRVVKPNLQKITLPGQKEQILVCAKCLRTLFKE